MGEPSSWTDRIDAGIAAEPAVASVQDQEVRRVGDNTPIYVNVRVLAATNAPLEQKIKDGSFREDLYYRLNVIPLHLPSLRERRDDIR